ncbi:MAG TPA: hypothetical protein VLL76_04335, partial [Candidatus Omnitrophota bacterium]|nr:hypothetical protein [Candidatus Omnitrophota bacterium]
SDAPVASGDAPRRHKLSSSDRSMLTRAMAEEGYNCPRAKDVATCGGRGDDMVLRIWCGPDDGSDDLTARMVYKVTFHKQYPTVRKWPGDPEECP